MDAQTKNLLTVIGISIGVIWILKPKNSLLAANDNKYSAPKEVSSSRSDEINNAGIALQAMKNAIDSNEPSSELKKLNTILSRDYKIKVKTLDDGKLAAINSLGKIILTEQ